MQRMDHLAHVVDADFGVVLLALVVPAPPQQENIRNRERGDPPRRRAVGGDGQRLRRLDLRSPRVGMGGEEARETPGQRRLADPLRPPMIQACASRLRR